MSDYTFTEDYDEVIEADDEESVAEDYDEELGEDYDEVIEAIIRPRTYTPPARRLPLRRVQARPTGSGVGTATLSTPAGAATLRLPTPVATQAEFREKITKLEGAINEANGRINSLQNDVRKVGADLNNVATNTTRQIVKVQADTKKILGKVIKEQKVSQAKLRKDMSSQATTNLMISMMMQKRLQDNIDEHTHSVTAGQTVTGASAKSETEKDNSMLMMLPLMMGDGMGDNSMMMMAMMFAFMD